MAFIIEAKGMKELKAILERHLPKVARDSVAKALRTAVNFTYSETVTFSTDTYNLSKRQAMARLSVERNIGGVPIDKMSAEIHADPKRISFIDFGAENTGRGVRVTTKRSAGPQFIRSAFIQHKMRKGGKGVFIRRGEKRLPIDKLRGPSLTQIISREGAQWVEEAKVKMTKVFLETLGGQLNKVTNRGQAKI